MLSPSKVWLAGFDFKQGGFGVVTKTDQTAPTSRRGRGGGGVQVLFANAMYERMYSQYLRFRVILARGLVRFL